MRCRVRLETLAASAFALALAVATSAQAPAKPPVKADGLIHTELSLLGRTASVSFVPNLQARAPEHRGIFSFGSRISGRARIGELATNGTLRIGDVSIGKPGATPLRFDLFLETAGDGSWQLNVVPAASSGGPDSPMSAGKIALTREPSAIESPTLVAALVPVARDSAQLVLTWNYLKATAGIQFQEVQLPPRPAGSGRQIAPVNRKHDAENDSARFTMLSQLNEAALVDAAGARVSVTFARTFPKGTQTQSAAGTARRPGLVVDGPDFARVMSTRDGAVVELTEAPALRLSIDGAVRSNQVVLRPGNQTPGFPGVYSLWLKRLGSGWRLVFNQEPDVWGSQRDPKSDVGEVELTHSKSGDPARPLLVALVPTAADRWRMVLAWGPHEWSADFAAVP
jgi:hypothetical protein